MFVSIVTTVNNMFQRNGMVIAPISKNGSGRVLTWNIVWWLSTFQVTLLSNLGSWLYISRVQYITQVRHNWPKERKSKVQWPATAALPVTTQNKYFSRWSATPYCYCHRYCVTLSISLCSIPAEVCAIIIRKCIFKVLRLRCYASCWMEIINRDTSCEGIVWIVSSVTDPYVIFKQL